MKGRKPAARTRLGIEAQEVTTSREKIFPQNHRFFIFLKLLFCFVLNSCKRQLLVIGQSVKKINKLIKEKTLYTETEQV
uniref:Uncharacterized protein n=1 Tax=Myripristis murdjan TaxID=586833 RepID=A0A667Y8R1_9TELE